MKMSKNRLESFSDGVIAIIITIMVLNIPLPKEVTPSSLLDLGFAIVVFFVSFLVVGAQWEKHHRLFSKCDEVSERVVWRNIIFLFFLSLLPLFTKWIMENPREVIPAISYDIVFLAVFISFKSVTNCVIKDDKTAREYFTEFRSRPYKRNQLIMFEVTIIVIIAVFVLSFFYPTISVVFFIGIPVASSLFNIWISKGDRKEGHKK